MITLKSFISLNFRTKLFDPLCRLPQYLTWWTLDAPISLKYLRIDPGVSSSEYLKRNNSYDGVVGLGGLPLGM